MTINDLQQKLNQLQAEKSDFQSRNKELVARLSEGGQQVQLPVSARDDTFGNLPTGLSARSQQAANAMMMGTRDSREVSNLLSQGTLPHVQSIDYMVLDLNAVK